MSASTAVTAGVLVSAPPPIAYPLFAAQVGAWWPLPERNVLGSDSSVAFEGTALVERNGRDSTVWAEVVEQQAPARMRLAFFPRVGPDHATDLVIAFTAVPEGTAVTLDHRGWERLVGEDGPDAGAQVRQGWSEVLEQYRRYVEAQR
jgi:uncharacterized protein YndB with AHSA1/START domain